MTKSNTTHEEKKAIVAEHIAKLIYIGGHSQVKLGKMLGVSHTTIQNYLNQKTLPDEAKIKVLASLAGVTPEQFMTKGGFTIGI